MPACMSLARVASCTRCNQAEGGYWIGYPASLHYMAISSNRTLTMREMVTITLF